MNLFEKFNQEDMSKLCPYAQRLLSELVPIVQKINRTKIGDESKIEIIKIKNDWSLYVLIEPRDKSISGLTVYAAESLCVLGYTDYGQPVCHKDPASDEQYLIRKVIDRTYKYLIGSQLLDTSAKEKNYT